MFFRMALESLTVSAVFNTLRPTNQATLYKLRVTVNWPILKKRPPSVLIGVKPVFII